MRSIANATARPSADDRASTTSVAGPSAPRDRTTTRQPVTADGQRNEPDTTILEDDVLIPAAGILQVIVPVFFIVAVFILGFCGANLPDAPVFKLAPAGLQIPLIETLIDYGANIKASGLTSPLRAAGNQQRSRVSSPPT